MADPEKSPKRHTKKTVKSEKPMAKNTKAKSIAEKAPKKTDKPAGETRSDAAAKKSGGFQDKLTKLGVKSKPNRKLVLIAGITALAALIITLITFGVLIYKYKSDSKPVQIMSAIVPYPVLSVNGNPLWNTSTYNEYLFELSSIKKFYSSQKQDLNSDEGKKRLAELKTELLKQLEDNQIIRQEAAKERITVTQKEVNDEYNKLVENAGGPDKVKETLTNLYGWTIPQFKEKVRFSLIQKKLADKISNDPSRNGAAKQKAEDLESWLQQQRDKAKISVYLKV